MSTITYGTYPRTTLSWSNNGLSNYVIITYYGNAIVGTGSINSQLSSGPIYDISWISPDLSYNAVYTFTLNMYNDYGDNTDSQQVTVDTTPYASYSFINSVTTNSSVILQWSGVYSYTRIYKKMTVPYVTALTELSKNTYLTQSSYYDDDDISGNATFVYFIQRYNSNKNPYLNTNTFPVYIAPHAARDLSPIYYDASSIRVSFTLPKNAYSSSYYYQLNAISNGVTMSASGTTTPLWVVNLSGSTQYNYYIDTYLDNVLSTSSIIYTFTTPRTEFMTTFFNLYYFDDAQIAYTDTSYSFVSVSVNADKTKMLMATICGELYYATSSDTINWNRSSQPLLSGLSKTLLTRNPGSTVQLSALGNYAIVVGGTSSLVYPTIIDWSGNVPVIDRTVTTVYASYPSGAASAVTASSGTIANSGTISYDGTLIIITLNNNQTYWGTYPTWKFYSFFSGNINRYPSLAGNKGLFINYGTATAMNYYSNWTGTAYGTTTTYTATIDAKSLSPLGGGYTGNPRYLFVKTYNSGGNKFNIGIAPLFTSFNSINNTFGKVTEISNNIMKNIDNFSGCNNCSDGITYYFPQNDKNIYYSTIRCEKNTTVEQIYKKAICWYKMTETNGSVINDSNGNFNTTSINCTRDPSGINGYCLNFNTSGNVILSHSLINNFKMYTISCWIKLNTLGTYIICSKQHDANNTYGVLSIGCYASSTGIYTAGTSGIVYWHSQNGLAQVASLNKLTTNTWYHIAVSANSNNCYIYINGLIDNSVAGNYGAINNAPTVTSSYLGYWYLTGAQKGSSINGYIDNFAVWNINLSPEAIYAIFRNDYTYFSSPPSLDNLTVWLDVIRGSTASNITFLDTTNNTYNATSTSSAVTIYSATALDGIKPGITITNAGYNITLPPFSNGITMFIIFDINGIYDQTLIAKQGNPNTVSFSVMGNTRTVGLGTTSYTRVTDAPNISLYTKRTIYSSTITRDGKYVEWFNGYLSYTFKGNYGFNDSTINTGSLFYNYGTTMYSTGVLSEVILYNSVLSLTQIQSVLYYLSSKWDISLNTNTTSYTANVILAYNMFKNTNYASATANIHWYSGYSYVKIYRKIVYPYSTSYIDLSVNNKIYNTPYYDYDLSGNTTYSYYIEPYDNNNKISSDVSNILTVTTLPLNAYDLSATVYTASSVNVTFKLPKNSYISSYYYQLNAVYNGVTTSVSGLNSPLLVTGLTGDTGMYNLYILTYLDGIIGNTARVSTKVLVDILIVGGGGGGAGNGGGGGGGGGVVYGTNVLLYPGTYTITVGNGGGWVTVGSNSSISRTGFTTITANGGGPGGGGGGFGGTGSAGGSGGCGGGGGNSNTTTPAGGTSNQISYSGYTSYGNAGGTNGGFVGPNYVSGGGGGAGAVGGNATSTTAPGVGGNGIQVNITGTLTYYAGGGGGSGQSVQSSGGLGGGGSGGGGNGSANTGGGGGSGRPSSNPGVGGSGIVILSIPTESLGTFTNGGTNGNPIVTINGSRTVLSFISSATYTN